MTSGHNSFQLQDRDPRETVATAGTKIAKIDYVL